MCSAWYLMASSNIYGKKILLSHASPYTVRPPPPSAQVWPHHAESRLNIPVSFGPSGEYSNTKSSKVKLCVQNECR